MLSANLDCLIFSSFQAIFLGLFSDENSMSHENFSSYHLEFAFLNLVFFLYIKAMCN
jgi:hypothetical protein